MHPYPHKYSVSAIGGPTGTVQVSSARLIDIATAAPAEFGGPGDLWSPETLLCGSIANCFVLTFRALARASKLEWFELNCRVAGVLERVDGVTRFSGYTTHAALRIPAGADAAPGRALLEKAEQGCPVANSLRGERVLVAEVMS